MAALILKLLNGFAKRGLKLADLAKDELRKPKQNRCIDAAFVQVVNDLFYVSGEVLIFRGVDDEVALAVYTEIIGTPIINSICLDALIYYCSQRCLP